MLISGMSTPIPAQSVETRSLHDLPINTIGPLNPTIHEGLEWPLQLNSLYVCLCVCGFFLGYKLSNSSPT